MKNKFVLFQIVMTLVFYSNSLSQDLKWNSIDIELKNTSRINRKSELISFNIAENAFLRELKEKEALVIISEKDTVYGEKIFNESQLSSVAFLIDFKEEEQINGKLLRIEDNSINGKVTKKTQAYLGVKKGYEYIDGYYSKGEFVSVKEAVLPKGHFPHNAYFQYEGIGWESNKVGYRIYLDERNRIDIFGKKSEEMVLDEVGIDDLVSDSKESYTKIQDWGMDIFKVGSSLGMGSFGRTVNDSVITVSETDSVRIKILNSGNITSNFKIDYFGWNNAAAKSNLTANFSINADDRLSKVTLTSNPSIDNYCTGLAKHPNAELISSNDDKSFNWGYIALYGNQAFTGEKLGIALFYNCDELIRKRSDSFSEIVDLKSDKGLVTYYFTACWEYEKDGIINKSEFIDYLNETLIRLSKPIKKSIIKIN